MSLKKKKRILDLLLIVVFAPILIGSMMEDHGLLIMMISWVLAIGWIILHAIWWRCPHCAEHLGRYGAKMSYCPHCGEKVDLDGE